MEHPAKETDTLENLELPRRMLVFRGRNRTTKEGGGKGEECVSPRAPTLLSASPLFYYLIPHPLFH